MTKSEDEIEKLLNDAVSDPNIIPGIHNYCDRWCERCTHTIHCTVYKMEKAMVSNPEEMDVSNKEFWKSFEAMINVATKLIHEKMKELEIEPSEIQKREDSDYDPVKDTTVTFARQYTIKVSEWMDANRDIILQKHNVIASVGGKNAIALADAFDVIQFYFMMIATKTYRSYLRYPFEEEDDGESQDAVGSAKVALIMIDRSIASWTKVFEVIPEFEDDSLGFCAHLSKLKKQILQKHPNAMSFKRPGFDD